MPRNDRDIGNRRKSNKECFLRHVVRPRKRCHPGRARRRAPRGELTTGLVSRRQRRSKRICAAGGSLWQYRAGYESYGCPQNGQEKENHPKKPVLSVKSVASFSRMHSLNRI